ncbi:hypothetical protein [Bacillus toyonensis]|uniref:hypothetical protein n=1 Tax=Bacillus toyonensis TaxID=155322 RepID=UPI000BF6F69A|nr:hypothetical protein [Bacillus toyonensis]PGF04984.1 hypothetical protein COM61_00660 [Bacillus toyonensis]
MHTTVEIKIPHEDSYISFGYMSVIIDGNKYTRIPNIPKQVQVNHQILVSMGECNYSPELNFFEMHIYKRDYTKIDIEPYYVSSDCIKERHVQDGFILLNRRKL